MKPYQPVVTAKKFKPFRLVNDHEVGQLQQIINEHLHLWNEQYALFPLSVQVKKPDKPRLDGAAGWRFSAEQAVCALVLQNDLSALNDCLFGDVSFCFTAISETLLLTLFQQLLANPALQQQPLTDSYDDWFYTGSPVLSLILTSQCYSLLAYLSPKWVMQALNTPKQHQKPLTTLHNALANTTLDCQVTLPVIPLRLRDLLDLQPGDVLKTEHPLTKPLTLKHQQHVISEVELGTHHDHKSIQLVSFVCPLP